jgi:hypothetical protein
MVMCQCSNCRRQLRPANSVHSLAQLPHHLNLGSLEMASVRVVQEGCRRGTGGAGGGCYVGKGGSFMGTDRHVPPTYVLVTLPPTTTRRPRMDPQLGVGGSVLHILFPSEEEDKEPTPHVRRH